MRTFLWAVVSIALLFIVFPNVVIQPYTTQAPWALDFSLFLLRYQKSVELICAGAAVLWLILGARSKGAIASAILVFLSAVGSRIDIYEKLFHPLGKPDFRTISETKLDGDEHLLAVSNRAYPIRTLTYHHIVNDVVDNVPIAVTY